jgi:hypothetical protein
VGGEKAREDRLLHLGAADHRQLRIAGDHRPRMRRHETHVLLRRASRRSGARAPYHCERHQLLAARVRRNMPYIIPIASQRKQNSDSGRKLEPTQPVMKKQISAVVAPWKKARISGLR